MTGESSALLSLYRAATAIFAPAAPLVLQWRTRLGKEDPARRREKLGFASLTRPAGRLAWLHGASVGESLALLPVVEALAARGFRTLVTTGTVSSAEILKTRLPAGAAHQYAPLDAPQFARRFLDHWRPDLVLFAESELWPNLLRDVHARGIPLALVNARLSERSFERWRRIPRFARAMLGQIDLCLAQSADDASRLASLGSRDARVCGNLKYDVPAPPVEPGELARLRAATNGRLVWLAASTHPGEEAIIARAHARLAQSLPSLLTIVAPRHAGRGPEIATVARQGGIDASLRSQGAGIDAGTRFYVADTMGELGLFYRLANIVFVGKSLGGESGGQNPIEPSKLGALTLHGPDVSNFLEVYSALDAAGGARAVADPDDLAAALAELFADPAMVRRMARAAGETVAKFGGATDSILRALEPWFPPAPEERG